MRSEVSGARSLGAAAMLGLVLALSTGAPAEAADAIAWKELFYNPHPLPKDLILPMPCGGAMAFRPVVVPADQPLGDRRVTLGGPDDRYGFAEGFRQDFLAGAFDVAGAAGGRQYYIGKYEVTADQYATLAGEACEPPTNMGRLPRTKVSWSEAIDFSVRYTEWLYAHAPEALPSEDKQRGYLRLPTEAEWEYAARGGAAVSDSEFMRPLFPMDGPLAQYAWVGSPESSGFKSQPIGLLKPNPLGLYDMLGNAAEMVLDPYRLNRISRLQGQAGGIIAKGGDYLTPPDAIRSAEREEINPFDDQGARRTETVGFRLVISATILTSPDRLAAIAKAWAALPKSDSPLAGTERLADPVEEIDQLIKATSDDALKERLAGLRSVIQANIATRNEQRDRAALAMLRLGAFLLTRIRDAKGVVAKYQTALEQLKVLPADDPNRKLQQKFFDEADGNLQAVLKYYVDTLSQIAQEYPARTIDSQFAVLMGEYEQRSLKKLELYADILRKNLAEFRKMGQLPSPSILKELE